MMRNLSGYTDTELVRLLRSEKQDSEAAFKELYSRYSSQVHAYCLRVTGNLQNAEDVFQETFIRFYQFVREDIPKTNIPGFLIKIARNLCLNEKRDKKAVTVPLDNFDFPNLESHSYENKELLDLINMALELLDFEFREAFVLREYNGMSYNDIAELCNVSVANAKSRVFRAKERIKAILQPYMKDLL